MTVPEVSEIDAGSAELDIAATLIRVANSARVLLDTALSPHRIGWAGYEILDLTCATGPVTYRELAHTLNRHRTSIRATVANLVDSGLVERYRGGIRRDEYQVAPTERGREIHRRCTRTLRDAGSTLRTGADPYSLISQLKDFEDRLRHVG